MKKILILFLLSFPIIIFTIVTLTSTVIAYYVPLAVEAIEVNKGADIADTSVNKLHDLEFQILPANARNMSFDIYDENGLLLVNYVQGKPIEVNNIPTHVIEVIYDNNFIEKGLVKLKLKTQNIGFSRLTITTKDGNYKAYSDVIVLDPNADPTEIQGVVLDYNKTTEHYKFGNKNEIRVGFTYFPKTAINKTGSEAESINEQLRQNALNLQFNITRAQLRDLAVNEYGRGSFILTPNSTNYEGIIKLEVLLNPIVSYEFPVQNGYNIYTSGQLISYSSLGSNLYIQDHISLNQLVTFRNGTKLYGNYFTIDHSGLSEYEEKDSNGNLLNIGKSAITFIGHNSGLYEVHIKGALDENQQPYENIVNVTMDAQGDNDKYMAVKDVIIENGRYNLSVIGKITSLDDPQSVFDIDKVELIGAFFASFEIDTHAFTATLSWATRVNLSRLKISYTAIGILIQNNRASNPGSYLYLYEVDGIPAITSTSWRNLDDATGALSSNNFGYIMSELKSDAYKDVYYKEGKNYYVNPVIMLRGGGRNRSEIFFDEDSTINDLIMKERKPNGVFEVGLLGGTHPFVIYLMNPERYPKGE